MTMPYREAFGESEIQAVYSVINFYKNKHEDPPYSGYFQKIFENSFSEKMGGGYSLAVSAGSIACYIAVRALNLPKGSEIIVGPATDSGSLFAIVQAGCIPVVCDAAENSFNADEVKIKDAITSKTSAIFVVHAAGEPIFINQLAIYCRERGIKIIEDCSQSPFARFCRNDCNCPRESCCEEAYVGTIGDIAAFSTMYRKSIHSGGSGGIVYTKSIDTYQRIIELADRGRPKWSESYRSRDPGHANLVSLNYNTDEFSCAIGNASLSRIDQTILSRRKFVFKLQIKLRLLAEKFINPHKMCRGNSPFFLPMIIDEKYVESKNKICDLLLEKGIDLVKKYDCVVSEWECLNLFEHRIHDDKNIKLMKVNSFNLFLNEKYGDFEVEKIVSSISEVYNLLKKNN
jgi:perosamine synthetase